MGSRAELGGNCGVTKAPGGPLIRLSCRRVREGPVVRPVSPTAQSNTAGASMARGQLAKRLGSLRQLSGGLFDLVPRHPFFMDDYHGRGSCALPRR